jgi:spore germination protein KA
MATPERSLTEPSTERNLEGQELAFTELLATNIKVIRHQINTRRLKVKYFTLGSITKTRVAVLHMDGLADPDTVQDVYSRITGLDVKYVPTHKVVGDELQDDGLWPFYGYLTVERFDAVCGGLMNGRVITIVDNSPLAIIVPSLFLEKFTFAGDYSASLGRFSGRWIRLFQYILYIYIPVAYIVMSKFYADTVPKAYMPFLKGEELLSMPYEIIIILVLVRTILDTTFRINVNLILMFSILCGAVFSILATETLLLNQYVLALVAISELVGFSLIKRLGRSMIVLQTTMSIAGYFLSWQGVALATGIVLLRMVLGKSFGVPYMSPLLPLRPRELWDTILFLGPMKKIINKTHRLKKGWW